MADEEEIEPVPTTAAFTTGPAHPPETEGGSRNSKTRTLHGVTFVRRPCLGPTSFIPTGIPHQYADFAPADAQAREEELLTPEEDEDAFRVYHERQRRFCQGTTPDPENGNPDPTEGQIHQRTSVSDATPRSTTDRAHRDQSS